MLTYFKGQVSKKEYTRAVGVHFDQQFRWIKWVFGIIFGILFISIVITVIRDPSIAKTLFPGIVFPFVLFTFPWWMPYLQSAGYDQKGNIYRTPIEGVIDESGIAINGQEVKASFQWKAYTHYRKSGDVVMLYQGKNCFHIFTRALFREEDWAQFLKVVEERISKRK